MNTKRVNDKEKKYCKEWINKFTEPTKGVSKRFNSYRLKHLVEYWADEYISNDSFIAACESIGIKMIPTDDSCINYYFAFKVRKEGICQRV